jgi:hypothetical protein
MREDRFSQWAKFQTKWHRPDPDRLRHAMCGLPLPSSIEIVYGIGRPSNPGQEALTPVPAACPYGRGIPVIHGQ